MGGGIASNGQRERGKLKGGLKRGNYEHTHMAL